MYPVLFRLGGLEITTFGVMVALGAALGLLLLRREMGRSGLDVGSGTDAALAGVLGGLAGAKLLFVIEHLDEGLAVSLLSRGGMSWFGGLTGGLVVGLVVIAWRRLPLLPMLAAAAPAVAIGQAVGRIGCLLVGDDYGRPTNLPWGIAFPEGLPPTFDRVHPTQIYESLALFAIAALLVRWRRRGVGDGGIVARYLLCAGAVRFAIEFVRVNVHVALGLTMAQLFSLAAIALGAAILATGSRR